MIQLENEPIKQRNIAIYKYAYEYLLDILPKKLNKMDLEKYFKGDNSKFTSLKDVFIQIIRSAQNYQRMPNVIKFNERYKEIGKILNNYDYLTIANTDVSEIYQTFRKEFNITTKDSKMNSWYKWSNSVVDAAKFINNFKDVEDFKKFIKLYDYNAVTRISLPLLISSKISGIGFALACDILKELGYLNYPKPDTHIIDIFTQLGLTDNNPINVFEAVVKMADDCLSVDKSATPYKVDKILWLISSGRFYLDNIKISRKKDTFIEYTKKKLLVS